MTAVIADSYFSESNDAGAVRLDADTGATNLYLEGNYYDGVTSTGPCNPDPNSCCRYAAQCCVDCGAGPGVAPPPGPPPAWNTSDYTGVIDDSSDWDNAMSTVYHIASSSGLPAGVTAGLGGAGTVRACPTGMYCPGGGSADACPAGGVSPTFSTSVGDCVGPTESPTDSSTSSPTGNPTPAADTPTGNPTGNPTGSPVGTPTRMPTRTPTGPPTSTPTGNPTLAPSTAAPTTADPTGSPTRGPTSAPTGAPSTTEPTTAGSLTTAPTSPPSATPNLTPAGKAIYQFPGDLAALGTADRDALKAALRRKVVSDSGGAVSDAAITGVTLRSGSIVAAVEFDSTVTMDDTRLLNASAAAPLRVGGTTYVASSVQVDGQPSAAEEPETGMGAGAIAGIVVALVRGVDTISGPLRHSCLFLTPMQPTTIHAVRWPRSWDADWCLPSDVATDSRLQAVVAAVVIAVVVDPTGRRRERSNAPAGGSKRGRVSPAPSDLESNAEAEPAGDRRRSSHTESAIQRRASTRRSVYEDEGPAGETATSAMLPAAGPAGKTELRVSVHSLADAAGAAVAQQ